MAASLSSFISNPSPCPAFHLILSLTHTPRHTPLSSPLSLCLKMAGQANCIRVTRLGSKRVAASLGVPESQPWSKKRVVFGEIKKCLRREDDDKGVDVSGKSDDPQMCSAYVDDICHYLHQMEVNFISFTYLFGQACM